MTAHATLDAPSAPLAPSAALPQDADRKLLETARAHIDSGDAPGALALLAQITNPRRAPERDELRGYALTLQADGGGP